jgi:hypothetical protein
MIPGRHFAAYANPEYADPESYWTITFLIIVFFFSSMICTK